MRKSARVWVGITKASVILLLLTGVAFAVSDIPAFRGKDQAEQARIQGLINGARKEKKLVWYGNMIEPEHAKIIEKGFQEYYGLPEVKIDYTYAITTNVIAQVEQAIRAKRPTPDISWFVLWAWYKDLLAAGQIMKYDSPMYKDYIYSHKAGNSMPGYWVSDSYTFSPMWSPKALEKAGIKNFNPTSWNDFVDPRLVKMISMGRIGRSQVFATIAIGIKKVCGDEWFQKMAKNKPGLFMKSAQGRDWCASGEYPIDLFSHAKNAQHVQKSGAEVKLLYPKEGIVAMPWAPIIFAAAPHPNTAKLFIDYVRSAAGTNQMAATDVSLLYGRPGVKAPPNEFLPKMEDIKVIPMDWDKDLAPAALAKFQKWVVDIGLDY